MNLSNVWPGVKTAWQLGLANVFQVLLYRLRVRARAVNVEPIAIEPGAVFLHSAPANAPEALPLSTGPRYFGWMPIESGTGEPPDWFLNPFTQQRYPRRGQPWYELPDTDSQCGDIKCIWELSRWEWALLFAQQYRCTGDATFVGRLNDWLSDWLEKNPPYRGPNWKCGQETSIRVMHVAMAALILDQIGKPSRALIDLIRLHLLRIEPTMSYAMAQDNNHGTSEAAALFIGGSWLAACGDASGQRWAERGRYWLQDRASRLIAPDGSFSQYSVNYHRLVLDTLGTAEVWRRRLDLPAFSERLRERTQAAARWLYALTDPLTGDAPNLGANDGARLLPLADTAYRDFRPTVQLAMALFAGHCAYPHDGLWNQSLQWLGVVLPDTRAPQAASRQFDNGGYAVLRRGSAMAVMRYPRFRFRPSHADALHVDLWKDGVNLLRDGGSYSYAEAEWMKYFSGTASHNTVQFDDRDQMPRLGRFLFGDWLDTEQMEPLQNGNDSTVFAAAYRDSHGARHHRRVVMEDARLRVEDRAENFGRKAVLRWRLMPGTWRIEGQTVTDSRHALSVSANVPVRRFALVTGWESRHYLEKTELPVLEVEIAEPGQLISEYRWA